MAKTLEKLKQVVEINTRVLQKIFGVQTVNDSNSIELQPISVVSTYEELENLNEKLKNEMEFAALTKQLGLLGGHTLSFVVRRILSRIISHNLALNLNWMGTDKKRSIQDFPRIIMLVSAAVRQTKDYAEASQAIIEDNIKRWFRYAGDRGGGRSKRKKMANKKSL